MDAVAAAIEQVRKDLCQGGILDQQLAGYEERMPQVQMAELVATVLETSEHALIEAGTGTGKSLAYLLPIVRSGKVALIATANKALQEQLFYKDIPFVSKHVQRFEAALIKGMGNYLCVQHFEDERSGFQGLIKDEGFVKLDKIMQRDTHEAFDGDLDMLDFPLDGRLRGRISADSNDCTWRSCTYFQDCYVRKMREKAEKAQVVVANHTLLLLDVMMDGWLLPDRDVVVLDEAHNLIDEATRAFTVTISPLMVESLLAQRRLRQYCDSGALERALGANTLAWARLADMISFGAKSRVLLLEPYEEGLRLASAIAEVNTSLRKNKPETLDEREDKLYDKLIQQATSLVADVRLVFGMLDQQMRVYYIERETNKRSHKETFSVSAAPVSVTDLLKKNLFSRANVIATSATLTVNSEFDFFKRQTGLEDARELILPYVFDYPNQSVLYVPRLLHDPAFGQENGKYLDELAEQMTMLVQVSEGRAFLLFTSQRALQGVLDRISFDLETHGFTILAQGFDVNRAELLRRFKISPKAILFGLRSFWEGVDVAGDALSLVAIDKLPFDPPDDPVHEARINQMKEQGQNWFGEYVLPQAILRLKQGVGRLLRTREDRGVLAILDKRLLTKSYGRQVVFSLPPARRTTNIDVVREFFGNDIEES